jgi:hypothetical protein
MSSHKELLESYRTNPKITVLSVQHGLQAFQTAANLFFLKETPAEKENWEKRFISQEKKSATLFFYKRKLRVNFKLGFKLLIGDNVLGEEKPLQDALDLWEEYL